MKPLEFLDLAAKLAATVDPHKTSPNPRVGCVLVNNGKIIADGAHQQHGEAHAEAIALNKFTPAEVKTSTLYITLEPCVNHHHKKTPACADLICRLKPQKVIIGALDPHFPGQGIAQLEQAGIQTQLIKSDHHQQLNPWFNTWIKQKKPFINLKIAQSLDGRITNGQQHLSNHLSRQEVHLMRARHSAILTTTKTVLTDNPKLNVRLEQTLTHPVSDPDIIVMGKSELPESLKLHEIANRKIHHLQTHNFKGLIDLCLKQGYSSILTECGSQLNSALMQTDLVDQIDLFIAPIHLGENFVPSFNQNSLLNLFELKNAKNHDHDLQLTYRRKAD